MQEERSLVFTRTKGNHLMNFVHSLEILTITAKSIKQPTRMYIGTIETRDIAALFSSDCISQQIPTKWLFLYFKHMPMKFIEGNLFFLHMKDEHCLSINCQNPQCRKRHCQNPDCSPSKRVCQGKHCQNFNCKVDHSPLAKFHWHRVELKPCFPEYNIPEKAKRLVIDSPHGNPPEELSFFKMEHQEHTMINLQDEARLNDYQKNWEEPDKIRYPLSSIGMILSFCRMPQTNTYQLPISSGTLVHQKLGVSCAHAFYQANYILEDAYIYLHCENDYQIFRIKKAFIPKEYEQLISQREQKIQHDYSLFQLEVTDGEMSHIAKKYGGMGMKFGWSDCKQEVHLYGYGVDTNTSNYGQRMQEWKPIGYHAKNDQQHNSFLYIKNHQLYHNIGTQGGVSGASVILKQYIDHYFHSKIIAIHITGPKLKPGRQEQQRNIATLLTQKVRKNYNRWVFKYLPHIITWAPCIQNKSQLQMRGNLIVKTSVNSGQYSRAYLYRAIEAGNLYSFKLRLAKYGKNKFNTAANIGIGVATVSDLADCRSQITCPHIKNSILLASDNHKNVKKGQIFSAHYESSRQEKWFIKEGGTVQISIDTQNNLAKFKVSDPRTNTSIKSNPIEFPCTFIEDYQQIRIFVSLHQEGDSIELIS